MPAMGDSVAEGTVLEWHKQEGDPVALDETIVEISTDKVDAEVPAPVAGMLVKQHVAEGDTVAVGALLAEIATDGSAVPAPGHRHRRPGRRGRPATRLRSGRRERHPGGRRHRGRLAGRPGRAQPARRSTSSPRPAASR